MKQSLKTNIILLVAGIVAIAASLYLYFSGTNQLRRDTKHAVATVTGYSDQEEGRTDDIETVYYYPIVTYDVSGNTVESQYSWGNTDKEYQIGEEIDIRYNPDDPEEFVIIGDKSIASNIIWVTPVGVILVLFALLRIIKPSIFSTMKAAIKERL